MASGARSTSRRPCSTRAWCPPWPPPWRTPRSGRAWPERPPASSARLRRHCPCRALALRLSSRSWRVGRHAAPRQPRFATDCSPTSPPRRLLRRGEGAQGGPMAAGTTAKILHVDLSTRQTRSEILPETVVRKYLGGGALASYILLRDMPAGADPLGPDNVLVFTTSVINGLSLSGTNRYTAAAKSPLTGGYGESEAGGWWGPELRAAGYEGLVIRGRAAEPTYLWIKDGEIQFRDAQPYWGQLSGEVQDGLQQELGDKRIRVLQTGVAGERGVRFAAIVNQLKHFHGRSGLGAVMGSKNLKAIVVRGSKPPVAVEKEQARG